MKKLRKLHVFLVTLLLGGAIMSFRLFDGNFSTESIHEWALDSLFLAAIIGVDASLYEAVEIDGVSRAVVTDENGLAAEPDADAEYAFELWQPETQKLGQDAADLDEVKVLEVTTYEGSPVVELEVSPIGLRLHLTSRAAADSLRALAG